MRNFFQHIIVNFIILLSFQPAISFNQSDSISTESFQNQKLLEKKFISKIPEARNRNFQALDLEVSLWSKRGPGHIGGRTRAIAIDKNNENRFFAGSASGGIWKSEDGGENWSKQTEFGDERSISGIVQDPRRNFQHIWYYCTGEGYGSAKHYIYGNGVYKSVDNGETWQPLMATRLNTPNSYNDGFFDICWKVTVNPSTGHVWVATDKGIARSTDQGQTWERIIEPSTNDHYTDVVCMNNFIFATISKKRNDLAEETGFFWSQDGGNTWQNITPTREQYALDFPSEFDRTVICAPETGKMRVHFFSHISGSDYRYHTFFWDNDLNGQWRRVDPPGENDRDRFLGVKSYSMVAKVKPGSPLGVQDEIFLGNKQLVHFSNEFRGQTTIVSPPVLHVDIHDIAFFPSDPGKMLIATDGGVYKCLNNNPDRILVSTFPINNGYVTTQAYSVAVPKTGTEQVVVAGFQDNGTWLSNTNSPETTWTELLGGDGGHCTFSNDGNSVFSTNQSLYHISKGGVMIDRSRWIRMPSEEYYRGDGSKAPFVPHIVFNPNQRSHEIYAALERGIIRFNLTNNNDFRLDHIMIGGNRVAEEELLNGVEEVLQNGESIESIAISKVPINILFFGTTKGRVFKVTNIYQERVNIEEITGVTFPNNKTIGCIAVDKTNANKIFVVVKGYNTISLYSTTNGGEDWTNISGNLEENPDGSGVGPAVNWFTIHTTDLGTKYFAGTSSGLFSTHSINGNNTFWAREGVEVIGDNIITMMDGRSSDGFFAVATHGAGIISGFQGSVEQAPTIVNPLEDITITKNSHSLLKDISHVAISNDEGEVNYSIVENQNPSVVSVTLENNLLSITPLLDKVGTSRVIIRLANREKYILRSLTVNVVENDLLFDQTLTDNSLFPVINNEFILLDDFNIPNGEEWTINTLKVNGKKNNNLNILPTKVWLTITSEKNNEQRIILNKQYQPNTGELTVETKKYTQNFLFKKEMRLAKGKYWVSVRASYNDNTQWKWSTKTLGGNAREINARGEVNPTTQKAWLKINGKKSNKRYESPYNLQANISEMQQTILTWELPNQLLENDLSEPRIEIQRANTELGFFNTIDCLPYGEIEYNDYNSFTIGGTYQYRIRVVGVRQSSPYSEVASINNFGFPGKPQNFRVLTTTNQHVLLLWDHDFTEVEEPNSYQIHRSLSSDIGFERIEDPVGFGAHRGYVDSGLNDGTRYYYKLIAINEFGETESETIFGTTQLNFPSELLALPKYNKKSIQIQWNDNATNEKGFRIYRSPSKENIERKNKEDLIAAVDKNTQSFVDTTTEGFDKVNKYFYLVEVFNDMEEATSHSEIIEVEINEKSSNKRLGNKQEIIVYPNPIENSFSVDLPNIKDNENIEWLMIDLYGKTVAKGINTTKSGVLKIEASQIKKGNYILKIKTKNSSFTSRVYKK